MVRKGCCQFAWQTFKFVPVPIGGTFHTVEETPGFGWKRVVLVDMNNWLMLRMSVGDTCGLIYK